MAPPEIFKNESSNNMGDGNTSRFPRLFFKKKHGSVTVSRLDGPCSKCPSLPHSSSNSQHTTTSSQCPSLPHSSFRSQCRSLPHPSTDSQHPPTGSKCRSVFTDDRCNSSIRGSDRPSFPKVQQSSKRHVPQEFKKILKHILPSTNRSPPSQPSDTIGVGILCISAEEMAEATDNWNESNALGKGGFGKVYKGILKNTELAIKRLERQLVDEPSLSELECMNRYRHDNILSLYGYGMDGDTLCLICPVMPNGSLFDQLQLKEESKPLVWSVRICKVATGAAKGLQYLHLIEPPLVHGDIKSANILLDEHFEPKIGDFGFAREGRQTQLSRICGTEPYLDREFRKEGKLSDKVDVYAFGVVLAELATGLRPLINQNGKSQFLRDYVHSYTGNIMDFLDNNAGPKSELYLQLFELAKACTNENSIQRPTMVTVYTDLKMLREKIIDLRTKYAGSEWNAQTDQFPNLEDHILTKGDVENLRGGLGPRKYQIFVLYADTDKSCADDIREKMELERGLDFCDVNRDLIDERPRDEYTLMRLISERCKKLLVVLSDEFSKNTVYTSLLKQAQSSAFAKKVINVIPCIFKWKNLPLEYRAYYSLDYEHRKHTSQFYDAVYKSCTEDIKPIERDSPGFPDLDEFGVFMPNTESTFSSFSSGRKKFSFFRKSSKRKGKGL